MLFLVFACSGMLRVWSSSSSTKTHFLKVFLCFIITLFILHFFAFLILHRSWLSCGRAKTSYCSWVTERDPAIKGAWQFQARFYFPVLGTARGRHSHYVLVREACLVQDEWKDGVTILSITCTQCCLQQFWMLLLVLLLKLQCKVTWVIFTDSPLSPLWSVWSVCRCLQQSADIDCGCMGRVFGEVFVQPVHIQPPWAGLMCEQINIASLPLFAPDLRELQTNLSHCLDPLWKTSLE